MVFRLAYFDLTLANCKDQLDRWTCVSRKILAILLFVTVVNKKVNMLLFNNNCCLLHPRGEGARVLLFTSRLVGGTCISLMKQLVQLLMLNNNRIYL